MLGEPPSAIMAMDPVETHLTQALAAELEAWRWEQWQELFGG